MVQRDELQNVFNGFLHLALAAFGFSGIHPVIDHPSTSRDGQQVDQAANAFLNSDVEEAGCLAHTDFEGIQNLNATSINIWPVVAHDALPLPLAAAEATWSVSLTTSTPASFFLYTPTYS